MLMVQSILLGISLMGGTLFCITGSSCHVADFPVQENFDFTKVTE